MVDLAILRAPLFVPANRPERFAKAAASGADAIILDLEDAVAPEAKDAARAALALDFTGLPVIVRINATGTPWHAGDMAAIIALRPAALMLPKAEDPATVAAVIAATGLPVIALIESAAGLVNARSIAALSGVQRLAFGSVDYCADLGCAHLREVLLPARCELVLASRLAAVAAPLDGVTVQLDDLDLCAGDAAHARSLGMGGKLCIHPRQVTRVRQAFEPDAAERDWARRVLAAGGGVATLDGAMIDEPVRIRARAILGQVDVGAMVEQERRSST